MSESREVEPGCLLLILIVVMAFSLSGIAKSLDRIADSQQCEVPRDGR